MKILGIVAKREDGLAREVGFRVREEPNYYVIEDVICRADGRALENGYGKVRHRAASGIAVYRGQMRLLIEELAGMFGGEVAWER